MSKGSRTKAQVRRDRKALQTLHKHGLLSRKPDLRKAPTAYQKKVISRYRNVLSGKAAVVRPADPKSYKGTFEVKGRAVIVPKSSKGERIGLSKSGKITRSYKTRAGKRRSTIIPVGPPSEARGALPLPAPRAKAYVYILPFARGRKPNQTIEYRRFTREGLVRFFREYDLKKNKTDDWLRSVEIEEVDPAYERELDRYINVSGEVVAEPDRTLPRGSTRYQTAKRRVKRALARAEDEYEGEDE